MSDKKKRGRLTGPFTPECQCGREKVRAGPNEEFLLCVKCDFFGMVHA